MEQLINQQELETNQTVTNSRPIVKLAQNISEWTKHFFTLTKEEKDAAGICDYKKDSFD